MEDNCSITTADVSSSIFLAKDSENPKIEEEEPSSTCIEEILGDEDDVFKSSNSPSFPPESINTTVIQSPLDPLAESYRVSFFSEICKISWLLMYQIQNQKWKWALLDWYSTKNLNSMKQNSMMIKHHTIKCVAFYEDFCGFLNLSIVFLNNASK